MLDNDDFIWKLFIVYDWNVELFFLQSFLNYAMLDNDDFIWKFRFDSNLIFDKLMKFNFEFKSIPQLFKSR